VIRTRAAVVAGLLIAALTGCGIPPERDAREVEPPPGPYAALESPATDIPRGTVEQTVYLVKDGKLVPVVRSVRGQSTVDTLIADLVAGPTEEELANGLTSALPGADLIGAVHVIDRQVTIAIPAGFEDTGRSDEYLAFGQIVCTLDARPDVSGVVFFDQGERVAAVPRGDLSLSTGPLTTADYAELINGNLPTPGPSTAPR
jgi:hypothetical protein